MSTGEILVAAIVVVLVFVAGVVVGATIMFRGGTALMRAAAQAVREGRPMAALAILDPDTDPRLVRLLVRERP